MRWAPGVSGGAATGLFLPLNWGASLRSPGSLSLYTGNHTSCHRGYGLQIKRSRVWMGGDPSPVLALSFNLCAQWKPSSGSGLCARLHPSAKAAWQGSLETGRWPQEQFKTGVWATQLSLAHVVLLWGPDASHLHWLSPLRSLVISKLFI